MLSKNKELVATLDNRNNGMLVLMNKRIDELYCIYIMYGIQEKAGIYFTKHYIWIQQVKYLLHIVAHLV